MKQFYAIELRESLSATEIEGYIIIVCDIECDIFLFGIMESSKVGIDLPVDLQLMFESAVSAVGLLTILNDSTTWFDDVCLTHKFTSSDDYFIERSFNEEFNLSEFIQTSIVFQPHLE